MRSFPQSSPLCLKFLHVRKTHLYVSIPMIMHVTGPTAKAINKLEDVMAGKCRDRTSKFIRYVRVAAVNR